MWRMELDLYEKRLILGCCLFIHFCWKKFSEKSYSRTECKSTFGSTLWRILVVIMYTESGERDFELSLWRFACFWWILLFKLTRDQIYDGWGLMNFTYFYYHHFHDDAGGFGIVSQSFDFMPNRKENFVKFFVFHFVSAAIIISFW